MTELQKTAKNLYKGNFEIVKVQMKQSSGGDVDGEFFFFDNPVIAKIDTKESFLGDIREEEEVLGVYYSYNRIVPADYIIVRRDKDINFYQMPFYSIDLHKKMKTELSYMKDNGTLKGYQWEENICPRFEVFAKNTLSNISLDKKNAKMFKQWNELKKKHPKAIILYRCGDFYKTCCVDAEIIAKVCGITLFTWGNNPMRCTAEFPCHAIDTYLPRMVQSCYRLVICDPTEDLKLKN